MGERGQTVGNGRRRVCHRIPDRTRHGSNFREVGSSDAQGVADEIADDIWEHRDEKLNNYLTVEQAATMAKTWKPGVGPLVTADYADNPGSGAYGDSMSLPAALLNDDVDDACFGPIQVTGTVQWVGDRAFTGSGPILDGLQRSFGATAVLRVQGIDILIVTVPQQILDLRQFEAFGIDPQKKTVVALKSMQHLRAAFTPIAGRIVVCDSGALCTLNYAALDYRNVSRPMYPLDNQD